MNIVKYIQQNLLFFSLIFYSILTIKGTNTAVDGHTGTFSGVYSAANAG